MDGFLFGKSLCEMQGSKNLCRLCSKFFFERPQTWTWLTRRQTEEKGVSQLYIKHWKTKNILKHICRIPFCTHFFGYFIEIFLSKHVPKKWSLKKNTFKCTKNTTDEIRWNPYRKFGHPMKSGQNPWSGFFFQYFSEKMVIFQISFKKLVVQHIVWLSESDQKLVTTNDLFLFNIRKLSQKTWTRYIYMYI